MIMIIVIDKHHHLYIDFWYFILSPGCDGCLLPPTASPHSGFGLHCCRLFQPIDMVSITIWNGVFVSTTNPKASVNYIHLWITTLVRPIKTGSWLRNWDFTNPYHNHNADSWPDFEPRKEWRDTSSNPRGFLISQAVTLRRICGMTWMMQSMNIATNKYDICIN